MAEPQFEENLAEQVSQTVEIIITSYMNYDIFNLMAQTFEGNLLSSPMLWCFLVLLAIVFSTFLLHLPLFGLHLAGKYSSADNPLPPYQQHEMRIFINAT